MENRRSIAGKEEEERGAASTLVGPARRSLRQWARPAPYTPSPRRFVSDFLSKPSPPIRNQHDTPRLSQSRLRDNANASTLEWNQVSGNRTFGLLEEKELVTVDDSEVAEIEKYLKERTFSRNEADHLLEVIRSRTPALNRVAPLSIMKSPTPMESESKQSGMLAHGAITWKPGDSVYSKANALGCTPIDIAKAYMRDLSSSRAGSTYQTRTSRDAESSSEKNDSSAKLRICWPGANLPVNNASCSTPHSSRGNAVQDATPSRTPYADLPFSRSTFKIKNDRDSCDVFSTGRKRRLVTLDEPKSQKAKFQDDTTKFFDPEASRENTMSTFAQRGANPINRSQHISLGKGKEIAPNGASALWVHNRKSTETAQKILSHLERAIPSPSEKPPMQRQINRELPSHSLLSKNKKRDSLQVGGNSNQKMPDFIMGDGPSKSDAVTTKQTSVRGGLGFTFPVPAVNAASSEPPPTPTMPSPRALPVSGDIPAVPSFSFGSSSSSRLVFNFGSPDNSSTILDEEPPTFKFGSEGKRLSFSFSEKGAVCC